MANAIVLDSYLFDALQAEREGENFPIDSDVVWEAFGHKHSYHARRFIGGIAEALAEYGLSRLGIADNQTRQKDKVYLSVKGFKFALARAKTDRGAEYLLHLLEIEEQYFAQLERLLLATPIESDNTRYNITCWKVWKDSGIRNPYYVRDAIVERYDHKIVNQIVCVTRLVYEDLLENFCSLDGADISELPPEKQRKFRESKGKANKREPQLIPDDWGCSQPELF